VNELAVVEDTVEVETSPTTSGFEVLVRQSTFLAQAEGMIPKQFRGKPNEIIAAGMYGQALGMDLIIALQSINVIEGKPSLNASAWSALIRSRGHSIEATEHTAEVCTLKGKRKDNGDEATATFSMADARLARLAHKDNWQKSPKDMLFARALTALGRRLFSDIAVGGMYTPDELDPGDDAPQLAVVTNDVVEAEVVNEDDKFSEAYNEASTAFTALTEDQQSRVLAFFYRKMEEAGNDVDRPWEELSDTWMHMITELAGKAAASDEAGEPEPSTGSPANPTYDKPVDRTDDPECAPNEEPF
jgi:hypothetical protein